MAHHSIHNGFPTDRLPGVQELLSGLPASTPAQQVTYTSSVQYPSTPHDLTHSRPSSAGSFKSSAWAGINSLSSSPVIALDRLALRDSQPTTPTSESFVSPAGVDEVASAFQSVENQPTLKRKSPSPEPGKRAKSSRSGVDKDGYRWVKAPGVLYTISDQMPIRGKWHHKSTERCRRAVGIELKAGILGPLEIDSKQAHQYSSRLSQTSQKSDRNDGSISDNQIREVAAKAITAAVHLLHKYGIPLKELYDCMGSDEIQGQLTAYAAAARREQPILAGDLPELHPEHLATLIAAGFVTKEGDSGAEQEADEYADSDSEPETKKQKKVPAKKAGVKKAPGKFGKPML